MKKVTSMAWWCGAAAGLVLAGLGARADEATVEIGSTSGLRLAAVAEFAMPFGVHESVFPTLTGFATGDIGWHNVDVDFPEQDLYTLVPSCSIRAVLVSVDPGLQIWFGPVNVQPGQAMVFGSPFFDYHPVVQIADPDAVPGTIYEARFIVQDTTQFYDSSPVLTLQFTPEMHVHCDGVDFNNDGSSFDPTDIDAFLSMFSEGPCIPASAMCNDIDFNNDGSVFDPCDVDAFLLVFSEGPCTLCGT